MNKVLAKRAALPLAFVAALVVSGFACAEESIAEKQRQQVASLLSQVNTQSVKISTDIISQPDSAATGGCLDSLSGAINIMALPIGPITLPTLPDLMYDQIKQRIMDFACSAANDWIAQQAGALSSAVSSSGLITVTISQGSAQSDWQSVEAADVAMSDAEIAAQVTTGNLGKIPAPILPDTPATIMSTTKEAQSVDHEIWDSKMGEAIELNGLWGDM